MKVYLLVVLAAACVTYLLTPVVRVLANRLGVLTPVRGRDVHKVPVPRLGGVAMYLGLVVALLIAKQTAFLGPALADQQFWAVVVSGGIMCLLGALDDMWELDWAVKLIGQILAALVLVRMGVQLVSLPIGGLTVGSSALSVFLTVIVVVALANAVNFVDGLDGLAAGMVGIGVSGFFIYSYVLSRLSGAETYASLAATLSAALVGVCLGFLPHNFHPARIFMGDSGALTLGFVTGAIIVIVTGQVDPNSVIRDSLAPSWLPILLPFAIMLLPLLDMGMAVVRRTRAGKSPFHADRMHLHHRLLNAGHSHRRAVLTMYLWSAIVSLGTAALVVLPPKAVGPVVFVAVLLGAGVTWLFLPGISTNDDVPAAAPKEEAK
ncbi:MraY family glycosyltransferase [Buchananella felis]|uniref:MraY family glycosyltransferase n=1 Tax=Buchananella felis TaxID=3231492 RepID=UPI0035276F9B